MRAGEAILRTVPLAFVQGWATLFFLMGSAHVQLCEQHLFRSSSDIYSTVRKINASSPVFKFHKVFFSFELCSELPWEMDVTCFRWPLGRLKQGTRCSLMMLMALTYDQEKLARWKILTLEILFMLMENLNIFIDGSRPRCERSVRAEKFSRFHASRRIRCQRYRFTKEN